MIEYDPHHWRDHFFDVRGSMLREICGRVLSTVAWAVVLTAIDLGVFPRYGLSETTLAIPPLAHSLTGFVLGLLLVFRTNASYDRFWEGRKQWGAIVNESRNLARSVSVHLAGDARLTRETLLWTAALPWSIMNRLRGRAQIAPAHLTAALPQEALREVEAHAHLPLAVGRQITRLLAEARRRGAISDYLLASIDHNVQLLIDYLGACERIHNTPLPFAYVVHLRRALILYCLTLPFALLEDFGWLTIPVTLVISYVLFGIEEIGVEIEDPFGDDENDLPLERICAAIEGNVAGLLPASDAGTWPSAAALPSSGQ
jgi:ion channel-forming bestrophin family protein